MSENPPYPTPNTLHALLAEAAFAPLPNVGWLRITGEDRVRWLNGMATNSIQALQQDQGCYNFFLNAQGRIQGDAIAWMRQDSILLETSRELAASLATMLDHFIIMDDVELTIGMGDVSEAAPAGLLLAGPKAAELLHQLELPADLEPLQLRQALWQGEEVLILRGHGPVVLRFELWSDPATLGLLAESLKHAGLREASVEALEQLRLLEGTPLFGKDIRDKDLPQETNQTRALHFSKGCYLGQEIVERIRSRGNVHRTFSGFLLTGDLPEAGTPLTATDAPEKPLGEITSAGLISVAGKPLTLALGYIRREALDRGAPLRYPGGTATPAPLPYPITISA